MKKYNNLIRNKAIIIVGDEVYGVEGNDIFTGSDSTTREYTGFASIFRDISEEYASGTHNMGSSITPNTTTPDSSVRGNSRGGSCGGFCDDSCCGLKPDLMGFMLL